jgi:hypothetical protein
MVIMAYCLKVEMLERRIHPHHHCTALITQEVPVHPITVMARSPILLQQLVMRLSHQTELFIAYEATGSTPWFIYVWENSARSARYANALFRCDTSGMDVGSYYPSSGLGKWIYAYSSGGAWYTNTPQASILAPYKGINSGSGTMRHPTPNGTYGTNYFFKFASQYGDSHYLGNVTQDMLTSNTNTGQFGDTTTINGINYTCMGNFGSSTNLWVKTS